MDKTHHTLLFPNDHPMIGLAPKVQDLSKDFLTKKRFNFFSILRCYADGGFLPITINPAFIVDWFAHHPIITYYDQDQPPVQRYPIFSKDGCLPKPAMDLMEKKHGLYDAMAIIYRYDTYYDLVAFSLPEFIDNPGSYYLSSLPLLDDFYQSFLAQGQDIIRVFEDKKIILPKEKRDKNVERLVLANLQGGYSLQGKSGPTYVSSKEYLILDLIKINKSTKDIASILNVSPTVIEEHVMHVMHVKERTGMDDPSAIMRAVRREGFKRTH